MCGLNVTRGTILFAKTSFMTKEKIEQNLVLKFTFEFALSIISFCERLESEKKYVVARQLLKSGTAVGANAMEAQNAESKADFIHKFKIAAKEAEETQYWLLLCDYSKTYPDCKELLAEIESINNVIGKNHFVL
jgi:four helix bundle protein